jgi:hypothetical protein
MALEMQYTETLVVTSCWCGIRLAIPDNLERWARKDPKHAIYCPMGHTFIYSNTLQEQLDQAKAREKKAVLREAATRALLKDEERSHAATRGHLTRTKKQVHRAEHGVCPHCKRSFENLARHMQSKHGSQIA